ncbi:MAG: hypothetical protein QM703_10065 [Gemmatales bacterium]
MRIESNDDLSLTLRQLKVAAPTLDRDRLLFEAGRRSVKPSWAWPMATAASLLLAVVTGIMAWHQSTAQHQAAVATFTTSVPQESTPLPKFTNDTPDPLSPFSYLALREESLTQKHPVLRTTSSDTKPMPILSAGSYVLPEWQR